VVVVGLVVIACFVSVDKVVVATVDVKVVGEVVSTEAVEDVKDVVVTS
jgi:hypothetical protein